MPPATRRRSPRPLPHGVAESSSGADRHPVDAIRREVRTCIWPHHEHAPISLYDRIADLPLTIESTDRTSRRRERADGTTRVTSTLVLLADDAFGAGEDVTFDVVDHEALPEPLPFDLAGEYTLREFSATLEDVDLFPTKPPEREISRTYRRWALESAALDLALTQAETNLATVLDRERSPVRFVACAPTPAGDTSRVEDLLAEEPETEFRLEPTPSWTDDTVETLASTDAVRVLDMHGQDREPADATPAPDRYARLFDAFPDAILEDPATAADLGQLVTANPERFAWDVPVESAAALREQSPAVDWCVVTPSRVGTLESLFELVEYCEAEDVAMYGGGQAELCVGRAHVQVFASLFYPTAPNDVAPRGYTDPSLDEELPTSPMAPPSDPVGLEWTGVW